MTFLVIVAGMTGAVGFAETVIELAAGTELELPAMRPTHATPE